MTDQAPARAKTLAEFFVEAERLKLTVHDILPGLLNDLASKGDPDALAALAARPAGAPTPQAAEPVADCRNELVVAVHTLASHYENDAARLHPDERKAAEGAIAHAMKVAARWNWNGTSRAAPVAMDRDTVSLRQWADKLDPFTRKGHPDNLTLKVVAHALRSLAGQQAGRDARSDDAVGAPPVDSLGQFLGVSPSGPGSTLQPTSSASASIPDADRELVEAAARAAGVPFDFSRDSMMAGWLVGRYGEDSDGDTVEDYSTMWKPLTDDGDALRLAVKLGIDVQLFALKSELRQGDPWVRANVDRLGRSFAEQAIDHYAATRRAIVRAAAAMAPALGMEARSGETPQAARPEGRQPGGEAKRPEDQRAPEAPAPRGEAC